MNGIPSFIKAGKRRLLQIEKQIGYMLDKLEQEAQIPLAELKDRYQEIDDAFCEYDRLAQALAACEILHEAEHPTNCGARRTRSKV